MLFPMINIIIIIISIIILSSYLLYLGSYIG
jgi:hypothetical protein